MFPFNDYREARDFLYGIFDEEEQINYELILFAKSYIPGNYSRHYKGTNKFWGNEDAHISESRYSSDYCPGRTCVGDIVPHSECYEGCGCSTKGSRYILEEWISGSYGECPISSSRQLVTMLYNHGGVGQTGWWYKHEDYNHKEFGWFWDYMRRKKGVELDD